MEDPVITKIKNQFDEKGNPAKIPLMNGRNFFEARFEEDGIYVDNLKNQPFLPWKTFSEAINCLKENDGQVKKGDSINFRLGDSGLDLSTMEGYIASKVYGCKIGDNVFRRITPIASILAWAEVCENTRGYILLLPETTDSSETASISVAFDNRDIELQNRLVSEDKEIDSLREEPEAALEKKSILEKSLEDTKENAGNLDEQLTNNKTELENVEKLHSERDKKLLELEQEVLQNKNTINELEESILTKNKDLQTLAGKIIAVDGGIRNLEEKLVGKEKKINTLEVALVTSEEKVKKLEKQLSDYKGEEKQAVQLREKEELIKQLKGTLASKEEEFSRLNEENRKYRRQQKFESDGLRQIEEQKASKKWWRRW